MYKEHYHSILHQQSHQNIIIVYNFQWLFAMEFRFRRRCWCWWLCVRGVEGRSWLGGVCFGVFFGVYFGCSAYIRHLCFVIYGWPVFVRLVQGPGFLIKFCCSKKKKKEKWYLNIHSVTTFATTFSLILTLFFTLSLLLWFSCNTYFFLCKLWLSP